MSLHAPAGSGSIGDDFALASRKKNLAIETIAV
jgi:hypothetical protein